MASQIRAGLVLFAAIVVCLTAWRWRRLPGRRALSWLSGWTRSRGGPRGFFDHRPRGLGNGFPAAQYRRYDGWVQRRDNSALPADLRESITARIAAPKAKLPPAATGVAHD